MYIVIEGIDGSGKDTQAELLVEQLRVFFSESEFQVPTIKLVAEPDEDSTAGKLLRQVLKSGESPEAHAGLFLANRMALHAQKVLPVLQTGGIIVSIRSFVSTLVYQQEHWPLDWLYDLHREMLAKPNMVFLLDLSPELGLERTSRRSSEKEVYERVDTLSRVRSRYLQVVKQKRWFKDLMAPNAGVFIVDASGPIEGIASVIWDIVRSAVAPSENAFLVTPSVTKVISLESNASGGVELTEEDSSS